MAVPSESILEKGANLIPGASSVIGTVKATINAAKNIKMILYVQFSGRITGYKANFG